MSTLAEPSLPQDKADTTGGRQVSGGWPLRADAPTSPPLSAMIRREVPTSRVPQFSVRDFL